MPPTNYRASEHGFARVMLIILGARAATNLDDAGFSFVKHQVICDSGTTLLNMKGYA
jgi:hypothetical protein